MKAETDSLLVAILRLLPVIILFFGGLFLLIQKRMNVIFWSILGLLVLEFIPFIIPKSHFQDKFWILYFSGAIYILLIHNLYKKIFFTLVKDVIFKILMSVIFLFVGLGVFYIHHRDPNFVYVFITSIEILIIFYPIYYFIKLVSGIIKYDLIQFIFNGIVLLFFSLEIMMYVMIKFLIESDLFFSIKIYEFRFYVMQLFYLSLIYFGWKIQKR